MPALSLIVSGAILMIVHGHISGLERPGGGLPVAFVHGIERKPGTGGLPGSG